MASTNIYYNRSADYNPDEVADGDSVEAEFDAIQLGFKKVEEIKAPLASPTFTGTPAAPTAAADTSTTQVATTAFVVGQAATASPVMDGPAAVGTSKKFARQDHVHPTDTSRAPIASPTFTGTPTAPTAAAGTSTTQLATTAFVANALGEKVSIQDLQKGTYVTAVDTGAANSYVVALSPAVESLTDGMEISFTPANSNSGASTIAVNGLGAVPIVGGALSVLQGGEIVAAGRVKLKYNSKISSFVVLSSNGPTQVKPATKSNHAISLGQIVANLANPGYIKIPGVDLSGNNITILIQYAGSTNGGSGSSIPITFPLTFSEVPYLTLSGTVDSGSGSQSSVYSRSTTGAVLTVKNTDGTTPARPISGYILAIGKL